MTGTKSQAGLGIVRETIAVRCTGMRIYHRQSGQLEYRAKNEMSGVATVGWCTQDLKYLDRLLGMRLWRNLHETRLERRASVGQLPCHGLRQEVVLVRDTSTEFLFVMVM
jgi:hypothetical protein